MRGFKLEAVSHLYKQVEVLWVKHAVQLATLAQDDPVFRFIKVDAIADGPMHVHPNEQCNVCPHATYHSRLSGQSTGEVNMMPLHPNEALLLNGAEVLNVCAVDCKRLQRNVIR